VLGENVFRLFLRYMVFAGILANASAVAFLLYWAAGKISSADWFRDVRRTTLGNLDGVEVTSVGPVGAGMINPVLRNLPAGVWLKIDQQSSNDTERFSRQAHAGAAFDPVRGRLMLFGSDTHAQNWDNTVRFFDMGTLQWSTAYPADDPATYRVSADGYPVAGEGVERPWAMHTFDAVEFDPIADRLIIASHPGHLNPSKFGGVERALWARVKNHPTWSFSVEHNRWEPLVAKGESFFPYGATFDLGRRRLIGVKSTGYWELDIDNAVWQRVAKGAPRAWHNSVAFDSDREIVVSFGTHDRSNDIWQYRVGDDSGIRMPTPGVRPAGASSPPLVYHPGIKRVVALVETSKSNRMGHTETWLYSTADDVWERVTSATIPFAIGMNYDMVFDPNHALLVLVASIPKEPVAVWVLRLN
jgi:hypothetical protein